MAAVRAHEHVYRALLEGPAAASSGSSGFSGATAGDAYAYAHAHAHASDARAVVADCATLATAPAAYAWLVEWAPLWRAVRAVEPALEDCCGNGCTPCIFDIYQDAYDRYEAALEAWRGRQPPAQAAGPGGAPGSAG
jgi:hypothetical protein